MLYESNSLQHTRKRSSLFFNIKTALCFIHLSPLWNVNEPHQWLSDVDVRWTRDHGDVRVQLGLHVTGCRQSHVRCGRIVVGFRA